MHRVFWNQAAAAYSSLYFFSFLSLQFSNIKIFCHTFLRNYEAYKVDTWYTRGQWVDVSCIPQSGCCCFFVAYFFLSNVQKLKFSSHFSQELWVQKCFNLVHLLTMGGCIVYTRIRLLPHICPFISSFFFLSDYQTLTISGERGGSVVECRTPEREVGGSKPTAAVLCPWARHFTPRKYWLITQEAVAPSRHDWKIVDWDVKPQHKQTNN